jgi:oligopeptide/dipeptide ABC transporter ATP-binding protein
MTVVPVLQISDLEVTYRHDPGLVARALGVKATALRAVDGISLELRRGEIVGIAGESGCGKSTLARVLVGLQEPDGGRVLLDGEPAKVPRSRADSRRVQMVFQDPTSSLNPSMTVGAAIAEPMLVNGLMPKDKIRERCLELLELVDLPEAVLDVYPRRLSGGQRQRVGIARALAAEPEILVADEPVAALDVSVQASVLNLFVRLRDELGLTVVLISHNLAVIRHVCQRVAVMYLGRVVEQADVEELFSSPQHPYTRALIDACPDLDRPPPDLLILGEPPSPYNRPDGCHFNPRCPLAVDVCRFESPQLQDHEGHLVACHLAWTDPAHPNQTAQPT